ncbi:MAG TPA: ABC transporter ATP-binding protein [Clostridia bacterium]|nr:ABC transporter ATP-binding protein [Clostridia bacterium]MDD4501863.1 ABC transporter ATP-binding protein [Clostridia bacterium]NLV34614.1 ABC transporter ATP-binding protein [Clostridiaceae bacterium]HQM95813.1 ABC transporter ATP-binding protein [Clostridia bacterium]HQO68856.1 ABC transporter ATP-binding protein [Clostridia bacterium]
MTEETTHILTNKPVPDDITKRLDELAFNQRLLFFIVGDLSKDSMYSQSVLAVTDKGLYCFDRTYDEGYKFASHESIEDIKIKRLYGNAIMVISAQSEDPYDFFRFTYSVANLCEAAADFSKRIKNGEAIDRSMEMVIAVFEKQFSSCPKCGRTLVRPGAACLNCQPKGKIAKKLMKYVIPQKKLLIICLIFSVITTAMSLVPPYITKMMVDDIIPKNNRSLLITVVFVLLGTYFIQYAVGALRSYLLRVSGDRIVAGLRSDIYAKAQYLPMKFYDKTSTGSVITRISSDTSTLQSFTLRITQEVVVQFFLLIGIIVIMFIMNWKLTLLSLIPVPLVVIGSRIFGKKILPYYRRIWRKWSAVSSILTDTIPGVRVIKAFTNEKGAIDKFDRYNEEWLKTDIKAARITTLFPQIVSFFVTCGSLLIWSVGGNLVMNTQSGLTLGLLVSFISYTSMFYGPVNFFANFNDSLQAAIAAAERVFDIIDAEPEPDFGKGIHPKKLVGKIQFRNVNFSFDRTKMTLKDINVDIEPGDIVGIVGTTGSGKSTLINLLMRYYDNYEGQILVDGQDIKQIDMEFYRAQMGYVQQEPMMFHDTIYNNIAYGNNNIQVEQVINAAKIANAHNFIIKLPDAYDTVLGERGTGLSGGERQRVSIARAVLRNPSIMIFDEATAAVDSETELLIQEAIERLIKGRTTLMIAHRLSTLRKANKILVVDEGQIIESGSPEELLAKKGKYYKLIEIQTMSSKLQKAKEEEKIE